MDGVQAVLDWLNDHGGHLCLGSFVLGMGWLLYWIVVMVPRRVFCWVGRHGNGIVT